MTEQKKFKKCRKRIYVDIKWDEEKNQSIDKNKWVTNCF